MLAHPLRQKLAARRPVLGTWSIISSPPLVEVLAARGFDFLILDMEHGLYDLGLLEACVRACESGGASPIIRVPGMNASAVQWALDVGGHGIVVPQVPNARDAETAVCMAKYSPDGTRGYNPFTRAGGFQRDAQAGTGKLSNAFGWTSIIVESASALAELEAICRIPHLDMVYVGQYDLSIALGFNGNTRDPRLEEIVWKAVHTIRAGGKYASLMVRNEKEIEAALAHGADVLVYGVDTQIIGDAASAAVEAFRERAHRKEG
jgi:4-hydroxy-2-oxoheptanedioate aldolase